MYVNVYMSTFDNGKDVLDCVSLLIQTEIRIQYHAIQCAWTKHVVNIGKLSIPKQTIDIYASSHWVPKFDGKYSTTNQATRGRTKKCLAHTY